MRTGQLFLFPPRRLYEELGCWGMQRKREIEGERAASCWYSSAAAVPDEAAIFTHSAAFFSAGI